MKLSLPKSSPFSEAKDKTHKLNKSKTFDGYKTTVRLTEEQYLILQKFKEKLGVSLPSLLRTAFFNHQKMPMIIPKSDTTKLLNEIMRIGNNVNQIAKHLNSGIYLDWHSEFKEVSQKLTEIIQLLASMGAR